jgi:hypothetical protein
MSISSARAVSRSMLGFATARATVPCPTAPGCAAFWLLEVDTQSLSAFAHELAALVAMTVGGVSITKDVFSALRHVFVWLAQTDGAQTLGLVLSTAAGRIAGAGRAALVWMVSMWSRAGRIDAVRLLAAWASALGRADGADFKGGGGMDDGGCSHNVSAAILQETFVNLGDVETMTKF